MQTLKNKNEDIDYYDSIGDFCSSVLASYNIGYGDKIFGGVNIVGDYNIIIDCLNYIVKNSDFKIFDTEINALGDDNSLYCLYLDGNKLINVFPIYDETYGYEIVGEYDELTYVWAKSSAEFIAINIGVDMIFFDIGNKPKNNSCSTKSKTYKISPTDIEKTLNDNIKSIELFYGLDVVETLCQAIDKINKGWFK